MAADGAGEDRAIAAYRAALRDGRAEPRRGLPDAVFRFALDIVPMVNVDLLVRDEAGRVLLAWRDDAHGRGWHVPGGIIRRGESFAERIAAVARLELGTAVTHEAEPWRVSQLPNEGRGHFVSLLFRCALATPVAPGAFARSPADAAPGDVAPGALAPGTLAPGTLAPGTLAWCAGAPPTLYPAHETYRALLAG